MDLHVQKKKKLRQNFRFIPDKIFSAELYPDEVLM